MRNLTVLSFALMLTACAYGALPTTDPPRPPVAAMLTCPPLPAPGSGLSDDLLANHLVTMEIHHLCRSRLDTLQEWVRRIGEPR